jgi:U3 small nucleolar RNA-associated protein 14
MSQKLSLEEAEGRRDRLAKMKALLFYHEVKSKRMKKIKSKDYHRRINKTAKRKVTPGLVGRGFQY